MTSPQILSATFTILFEGLVTFVGPSASSKTHVVVVDAAHHDKPHIVVNQKQIKLEKGDEITFDLGSGPAMTDTSFDSRVPTLTDYIITGDLDDDVKQKKPHAKVLAFVNLPAGTLSAEGVFDHPVELTRKNGTKEQRCVARKARFKKEVATGDVLITITGPKRKKGGEKYTVPADAVVEIVNISMEHGMHFSEFGGLLKENATLGGVTELRSACDADGNIVEPATDPGMARVFLYTPNGDCGPTDYP